MMITNLGMLPLMLECASTITPCGSFPWLVGLVSLFMHHCFLYCTPSLPLVMPSFVLYLIHAWTFSSSFYSCISLVDNIYLKEYTCNDKGIVVTKLRVTFYAKKSLFKHLA
jgi:hypothetical protein